MDAAAVEKVNACDTKECVDSGCDWRSAPFLCLQGESANGCSSDPNTWAPETSKCDSFCDLSDCQAVLEAAGQVKGEEGLPRYCSLCDEDQCALLATQWFQACGAGAPFVCLSGSAMWGCASLQLTWEAVPETTCGECCNVEGC
ncbi:unnamed protein product [Choristocarpus tenellus]